MAPAGNVNRLWTGDILLLLEVMIEKDFKVRYRSMSLGVLWSVLNPLVSLGVLTFVFSVVFPNRRIEHFPIFFLTGLIPFNFMVAALQGGSQSLVDNSAMLKRVAFPREVVPLSTILSMLPHVGINLALLMVFSIATGLPPNVHWLWVLPVWTLLITLFCGLAMLLSPLAVIIRDTRYIVDAVVAVSFWLIPLLYNEEDVPAEWRTLYGLNPMVIATQLHRAMFMRAEMPDLNRMVVLLVETIVICGAGWLYFRSMKKQVAAYL